jgi:UDP-glucose 4-epimerase
MTTPEPIPVYKKSAELFAGLVADRDGLELVNLRISTIWGPPDRRPSPPSEYADDATKHSDFVAALPAATVELRQGRGPDGPGRDTYLDITHIRDDTGYKPEYALERGMADYVDWLNAAA